VSVFGSISLSSSETSCWIPKLTMESTVLKGLDWREYIRPKEQKFLEILSLGSFSVSSVSRGRLRLLKKSQNFRNHKLSGARLTSAECSYLQLGKRGKAYFEQLLATRDWGQDFQTKIQPWWLRNVVCATEEGTKRWLWLGQEKEVFKRFVKKPKWVIG